MKTTSSLAVIAAFLFCSLLMITSCKKDPIKDDGLGADPIGPDRALPYSYPDWMKYIDDNKYLSEITIPATHDCGADLHTSAQGLLSKKTIAQDFRIANQLLLGVRWFDIRLNDDDGTMTLYHGSYYLHKNFNDLIRPTLDFLTAHPTESVVFMIKQEHSNRGDDAFANGVLGYLNWSYPDRFWMGDHIPQLKEVRGKVVIVRQFWGTHGYPLGMPLIWNNNTTGSFGATDDPNLYVYVQDHYSLNNVNLDTKVSEIKDCLEKAHNEPYPYRCYYLNFTSGEQVIAGHELQDVAAYINPRINDFLLSGNIWHNVGVVFVNFAGGSDDGQVPNDLVKTLVNINEFADSVKIGTQIWTNKNLNVTHYRNGEAIAHVTDPTAWQNLTTGAYCEYNNGANDCGKLYNWYAVNDPRGLAPTGWHVATNAEWTTLVAHVGGASVAAGKLKDAGTAHWWSPNSGATNQYLFSAYAGGARWGSAFGSWGETAMFWTSTAAGTDASSIWMNYNSTIIQYQNYAKINGFSVRCIKD